MLDGFGLDMVMKWNLPGDVGWDFLEKYRKKIMFLDARWILAGHDLGHGMVMTCKT